MSVAGSGALDLGHSRIGPVVGKARCERMHGLADSVQDIKLWVSVLGFNEALQAGCKKKCIRFSLQRYKP